MTAVMAPGTNYKNNTVWYGMNPKIEEKHLSIDWTPILFDIYVVYYYDVKIYFYDDMIVRG